MPATVLTIQQCRLILFWNKFKAPFNFLLYIWPYSIRNGTEIENTLAFPPSISHLGLMVRHYLDLKIQVTKKPPLNSLSQITLGYF